MGGDPGGAHDLPPSGGLGFEKRDHLVRPLVDRFDALGGHGLLHLRQCYRLGVGVRMDDKRLTGGEQQGVAVGGRFGD